MRILILSQWFDPEPAIKGLAFAKALHARGHEVQVLTGFPNYPGGTVYPPYRIRWRQRESFDGVEVIRVPLYPSHSRSVLGRMTNYLTFALSAAVLGPWLTRRADVTYVYHPPGTIALPAIVLRLLKGTPYVFDIADLWPDSLAATGMARQAAVVRLLGWWCQVASRLAAKVVATSPGYVPCLIARGVPAAKLEVIHNWCDEEQIGSPHSTPEARQALGFDGRFNVVFAGNMGSAQALDSVLDAAALAASDVPDAHFIFIGGGIDAAGLEQRAQARALHNVTFLPRRPFAEIGAVLAQAEVLLVHLADRPLFRMTTPSKIQAYLYMGKPILAAVRGDAADLVERAGAGMVCEPESPASLCDAIRRLAAMPAEELRGAGTRGREFYLRELSMNVGVQRFEKMFESVIRHAH